MKQFLMSLAVLSFAAQSLAVGTFTTRLVNKTPDADRYWRYNVAITCDVATSAASGVLKESDDATTAIYFGKLISVITSPTATVTNNWDLALKNDRSVNLLSVTHDSTTTDYGANLSNSASKQIDFWSGSRGLCTWLKVEITNTTGTIYLSLIIER